MNLMTTPLCPVSFMTICVSHYYNLRTLSIITKCCSPYHKMRRLDLLQIPANFITQCAHYYKMPQSLPPTKCRRTLVFSIRTVSQVSLFFFPLHSWPVRPARTSVKTRRGETRSLTCCTDLEHSLQEVFN